MPRPTRAGKMRDRVTFRTPTDTVGAGGQPTVTWADLRTVWADVEADAMTEVEAKDRPTARTVWTIFTRYMSDYNETLRVVHDGITMEITGIVADKFRRYVTITAVEEE